jgi:hypothetical protein
MRIRVLSGSFMSRIRMDSHHFGKLDLDPNPHQVESWIRIRIKGKSKIRIRIRIKVEKSFLFCMGESWKK